MCGARPRAPRTVQQGPSKAQIQQQQRDLDKFRKDTQRQQKEMQTQLQQQIDEARQAREQQAAELARLQAEQQAADQAARAAAKATLQITQGTEAPESAATTEEAKPVARRNRANLQISSAAPATSQGAGINIGS